MSDHRELAFYQQALTATSSERPALRDEFLRRLIAAAITIDVNGIFTGLPAPLTLGGLSLASLVAGDLLYATGASAITRLAAGAAGTLLKGGAVPSWSALVETDLGLTDVTTGDASASKHGWLPKLSGVASQVLNGAGAFVTPAMTLLKAGSGTDTNAAATNLDTVAISGLTAKDSLLVVATMEAVTQAVATPQLYNSTDSVQINTLSGSLSATSKTAFHGVIAQMQAGATSVSSVGVGVSGVRQTDSTFTTNWTGSWTLALRHAGVTAGGTCKWTWAVYKLAGQ